MWRACQRKRARAGHEAATIRAPESVERGAHAGAVDVRANTRPWDDRETALVRPIACPCGFERALGPGSRDPERGARAYGVFTDVAENQRGGLKALEQVEKPPDILAHEVKMRAFLAAVDAALAVFSDEERLYMKYRRDVECHPLQQFYNLKVRNGRLLETQVVLGKTWSIEAMDTALSALLLRYGINEPAVAMDFAKRLLRPMLAVRLAAGPVFPI